MPIRAADSGVADSGQAEVEEVEALEEVEVMEEVEASDEATEADQDYSTERKVTVGKGSVDLARLVEAAGKGVLIVTTLFRMEEGVGPLVAAVAAVGHMGETGGLHTRTILRIASECSNGTPL